MNRLKLYRKMKGISQRELADMIGRPQSFIGKLESGQNDLNNLTLKNAYILSKALDCTIDDFIDVDRIELNINTIEQVRNSKGKLTADDKKRLLKEIEHLKDIVMSEE